MFVFTYQETTGIWIIIVSSKLEQIFACWIFVTWFIKSNIEVRVCWTRYTKILDRPSINTYNWHILSWNIFFPHSFPSILIELVINLRNVRNKNLNLGWIFKTQLNHFTVILCYKATHHKNFSWPYFAQSSKSTAHTCSCYKSKRRSSNSAKLELRIWTFGHTS